MAQAAAGPPALDDCFALDRQQIRLVEALDLLRQRLSPVTGVETVPLAAAAGRYLAEPVIAERDAPAFDNAAMDGFGLAAADLAPGGPTRLTLARRIGAGDPAGPPLESGQAVRILTGAPVPAGVDMVVMQESCRLFENAVTSAGGGKVEIPEGVRAGANIRRAGEDIAEAETVLNSGHRLRPQDLGAAAAGGVAEMVVHRPLKVALLSNGNELVEPGAPAGASAVYDANRPIFRACLAALGCAVTDLGILGDDRPALEAALTGAAADHDLILASAGASRGDADHLVATVRDRGDLHFWQLAIKPGRPVALGRLDGAAFIGLPGNPVGALVTFLRLAQPAIRRLAGGLWHEPASFPLPAAFSMDKKPRRREWVRARLTLGPEGRLAVSRAGASGSGILTSMVAADGLVELDEACTGVTAGDEVAFLPFSELGIAG